MNTHLTCTARASAALVLGSLLSAGVQAHTSSVGYESAGPGSVTFWYGTYHSSAEATATEGSLLVTGGGGYSVTVPFTLLVYAKPSGLIDGTNNFYTNGTTLIGTYSGTILAWQGTTFTGLAEGTYTFTYVPINNPSATWNPGGTNSPIRSSSVTLTSADVGGGSGLFSPNANTRSSGAAGVLDSLAGSATGELGAAIAALAALPASQQAAVLQHIAPQTNRALGAASAQTVSGALDTVQVRMDAVRTQGFVTSLMEDMLQGQVMLASADSGAGLVTDDAPRTRGVWGKVFGSEARQGLNGGYAGYQANTYGLSLGADTLVNNQWVLGGAFTYASTDVALRDSFAGDGSDIKSYQLTGYATRDFGPWYLEGMLAYARQDFNSVRNTVVSGIAQGDFKGDQWAARLSAGKPWAVSDKVTLTPSVGLEANRFQQDGYTETGGGPLSLNVDEQSATRVRSVLGVKAATRFDLTGGAVLTPAVHAFWRHEFKRGGVDTTSTFTGGGASFLTPGQKLARNTLNIGGSLVYEKSKTFSLSLQIDGERSPHYGAASAQVVGLWRF
ncbi:autotransporter outer membrane beta-barrel domain-containing protein [Aquabacterium sp.]|uniref:autotransporter family protein n=1 Tax=Aquabacterium sp. TaxID=1872578 RepID=UPI003D6D3DE5